MRIQTVSLVLLLCALALFPTPARADGIIIPEPPICEPGPCPMPPLPMKQLVIRYHRVTVTIHDQIAVTRVDQVFYNPNDWEVEGTYVFPLPEGAVVNEFTLWVDERPVEGEILDAEQARQIYEETVRSLRDPALLEYADRGAVKASIYPIPPGGERRIELEYTQALTAENGLVRYVYPLNTEKFSAWPLESVSISVDIRSTGAPIRAVYSPSHEVSINRAGEGHVTVGYEENNVTPETDFVLYYSLGEQEAFHLLTYRDPADPTDPDGFFLLLLAPRPEAGSQSVAKDVLLVLDRSGSMEGEKFQQAQEALRYILRHLNPEDRFNIITFSTDLQTYAGRLRPASEAEEAIAWVDRQSAAGSTDINRALLEAAAIAEGERPTYLIFLTDGLPTTGETDSERILANFAESAPADLRLFAFGVGYDVDTFLLDSLAEEHHGSSAYVLPDERLDETLSAFYAKISTPVLTDLELDFGNLPVYDLYPSPLPDLFAGSQIIVVGRYRKGGT
ncbi:MAG: VWA domain-containing protein, partial [Anaerolineae bacterium]